jgi:hypothetical protein
MPITLLRWKSGAAGDTVLRLLLDSDPNLHSQNKYTTLVDAQSVSDISYIKSFKYDQIAEMSLMNGHTKLDQHMLFDQLHQLEQSDPQKQWMIKTHAYFDFLYPVIDIVVDHEQMPFVIKASLTKNSRAKNRVPEYHLMTSKISDPEVLYKFDCFNFAKDLIQTKYCDQQINLKDILGGWSNLVNALHQVNLTVSADCESYYTQWLENNQQFMPSDTFLSLLRCKNFDYDHAGLTIEERYCLLVLSGGKFTILK